ncbi:hypothetical protein DdX_10061 [Ditylenchus destructor]|uniref:Uncharacterized protein n=1 Tax=Ditylenchus destructor TaxID=166010 RepID=A0AAD4R5W1_9BILA|nr:hypothetical protein DdX_10061 [Ditylenchus destructor]
MSVLDVESGYDCINGRMREQKMTCSWYLDLTEKSLKDYCINVHIIRGCFLPYIKQECGKKVIHAYVALFAFNANLRAYGDAIFDELADKTEPDECNSLMTGSIGPIPKTTLEPTGEPTSTVIEFPTTANNDTALNSTDEEPDLDDSTPENCGPVQRAFHISGIFLGCVLTLFWTG